MYHCDRKPPVCVYLTTALFFQQVRGVITSPFGIVTASRDKTIRVWTEAGNDFNLDKSLVSNVRQIHSACIASLLTRKVPLQVGHTNYVAPLAYVLPGHLPRLPEGGLLSGDCCACCS